LLNRFDACVRTQSHQNAIKCVNALNERPVRREKRSPATSQHKFFFRDFVFHKHEPVLFKFSGHVFVSLVKEAFFVELAVKTGNCFYFLFGAKQWRLLSFKPTLSTPPPLHPKKS
jgi:hypothetical protein